MGNKYTTNLNKDDIIIGKIYIHRNKINNKCYIGQTYQNPKDRWGSNGSTYKTNPYFWRAIQKYGWDNFDHIILPEVYNNLDELNKAEEYYIMKFNSLSPNGYNNKTGGYNRVYSEEFRLKLSKSHKGQVPVCKGKKMIDICPTYINGMKNKDANNKGKIKIHNKELKISKFIFSNELDDYLRKGWFKGQMKI